LIISKELSREIFFITLFVIGTLWAFWIFIDIYFINMWSTNQALYKSWWTNIPGTAWIRLLIVKKHPDEYGN